MCVCGGGGPERRRGEIHPGWGGGVPGLGGGPGLEGGPQHVSGRSPAWRRVSADSSTQRILDCNIDAFVVECVSKKMSSVPCKGDCP